MKQSYAKPSLNTRRFPGSPDLLANASDWHFDGHDGTWRQLSFPGPIGDIEDGTPLDDLLKTAGFSDLRTIAGDPKQEFAVELATFVWSEKHREFNFVFVVTFESQVARVFVKTWPDALSFMAAVRDFATFADAAVERGAAE